MSDSTVFVTPGTLAGRAASRAAVALEPLYNPPRFRDGLGITFLFGLAFMSLAVKLWHDVRSERRREREVRDRNCCQWTCAGPHNGAQTLGFVALGGWRSGLTRRS